MRRLARRLSMRLGVPALSCLAALVCNAAAPAAKPASTPAATEIRGKTQMSCSS